MSRPTPVREARLRPEFASLYPGIEPGVWLETTSVNVPGIAAYARLGYVLCGADVTVYDTLPYADEAAIYLAKSL